MTNLEHLITNKEQLAQILISDYETYEIIDKWYCESKCPYREYCDRCSWCEEKAFRDIVIEWMDSEHSN